MIKIIEDEPKLVLKIFYSTYTSKKLKEIKIKKYNQ